MIKIQIQILTATTVEALEDAITHCASNGWRLHEGILITAWEDVRTMGSEWGEFTIRATACGFTQTMIRAERTCKPSQTDHESA